MLVHAPSHRLCFRLPLLLLALCAPPAFGADGLDDPGGYASIPFDLDFTRSDYGRACAAQSDGKVLLAGSATDDDGEETKIAVARLQRDGLLDQSFGSDGLGGGRVVVTLSEQGVQAIRGQALALTVDPQGRVLVAGTMVRIDNSESIGFVTRLLPDGRIDPVWYPAGWYLDFDMTGVVAMGFGANGYLWLLGPSALDSFNLWTVTVLDSVGVPVATDSISFPGHGFESTRPTALAFQPDGKVLLGGWATRGAPSHQTSFVLARFLALTLLPDPTFGSTGDGQVVLDYPESAYLRAISLQPDHHIVVAGEIGPPASTSIAITRLGANGSVLGGFTEYVSFGLGPGSDGGSGFNRMIVQSDSKILIAANVATGDPANIVDVGVARILEAGGLDTAFGGLGTGKRIFDMPPVGSADGNDTLTCLTLSGGKPVVVGSGRYGGLDWDFSLRRLTNALVFVDSFESGTAFYWSAVTP